jgi:hypothetical protein
MTDESLHREWGKSLFNGVWDLIETVDRTPDDDALMIHRAHASLWHWLQVGTPVNAARGEWMCSRVYTVLSRDEPALYHARRVLDICERNGIGDWDISYAYEALARAYATAGDREQARQWLDKAQASVADVKEEEDREHLLEDLATITT